MEDECGARKHKWRVVSAVRDYPKGCEGSSKMMPLQTKQPLIGEEERTEMSTRAALEAFRRANPNHRLIDPIPLGIRPITNRSSTKGPSRESKCNGRSVLQGMSRNRMIVHGLMAAPNCSWKRASTSSISTTTTTSGVKKQCKEKRPNIKTTYSVCHRY